MKRKLSVLIILGCVLLVTVFTGGTIMADEDLSVSSDNTTGNVPTSNTTASDNQTSDNGTAVCRYLLEIMNRIEDLENRIIAAADNTSIDVTPVLERLMHSAYNRMEVLCRNYENAPAGARHGIQNAIENTLRKYERYLERIQNAGSDDRIMNGTANDSAQGQGNKNTYQNQENKGGGKDNRGNHGNHGKK